MKHLKDGTPVVDIIRYMTLEYRDKFLKEWNKERYGKSMDDLSGEEFVEYAEKAFNYFIKETKHFVNQNRHFTVIANLDTMEYFFSTDHCQEVEEGFIPVTHYLPKRMSKEEVVEKYYSDHKEIPNPNSEYQA